MKPAPICVEGRNCWRIAPANRAAFLIDGDAYYSALASTFKRARHSILINGWQLDSRFPSLSGRFDLPRLWRLFARSRASQPPAPHLYSALGFRHDLRHRQRDRSALCSEVRPDLVDVPVAIARTEAEYNNHPEVREVERLYLDSIRAAEHLIYLENPACRRRIWQCVTDPPRDKRTPTSRRQLSRPPAARRH